MSEGGMQKVTPEEAYAKERERLNIESDEALAEMHRLTREYREAHDKAFSRYVEATDAIAELDHKEYPELFEGSNE